MHRKHQDILNLNFTVHQYIFCTHLWGFIYTMGVPWTYGSEPLPWNKVCVLSNATFLWIHSSDSSGKFTFIIAEYAVVHLVEALHYKPEGHRFDSRWGSLDYFIDLIISAELWPKGCPNIAQKWVPEASPVGRGSQCIGLTTSPPSCADCLEILGASSPWNP